MKVDNLPLSINKIFLFRHFIYHNGLFRSIINESKLINKTELENELYYAIENNSQNIIWEIVKGDNGEYFRTIGAETPQYVAVISQEEWHEKCSKIRLIL